MRTASLVAQGVRRRPSPGRSARFSERDRTAKIESMIASLFAIYLAACAVPATAGVLFKPGDWYGGLSKPRWTPPDWLFPVVWAFLYVAMALAAARVAALPGTSLASAFWTLQISINTLWSAVFFGLHRIAAGGIIIAVLWGAVATTLILFWRYDEFAGVLMVPYLLWVTLALALNWSVWARNRKTAQL